MNRLPISPRSFHSLHSAVHRVFSITLVGNGITLCTLRNYAFSYVVYSLAKQTTCSSFHRTTMELCWNVAFLFKRTVYPSNLRLSENKLFTSRCIPKLFTSRCISINLHHLAMVYMLYMYALLNFDRCILVNIAPVSTKAYHIHIYIYHVAMVTTGLTPLYIHLSKIQHSI